MLIRRQGSSLGPTTQRFNISCLMKIMARDIICEIIPAN